MYSVWCVTVWISMEPTRHTELHILIHIVGILSIIQIQFWTIWNAGLMFNQKTFPQLESSVNRVFIEPLRASEPLETRTAAAGLVDLFSCRRFVFFNTSNWPGAPGVQTCHFKESSCSRRVPLMRFLSVLVFAVITSRRYYRRCLCT